MYDNDKSKMSTPLTAYLKIYLQISYTSIINHFGHNLVSVDLRSRVWESVILPGSFRPGLVNEDSYTPLCSSLYSGEVTTSI